MSKIFDNVPLPKYPRSVFPLYQGHDTTIKAAGDLVPVYHEEVLPGDTFMMDSRIFVRMATPIKPFFTNCYVNIQFYFVPNRIIWDNWVKMMGERRDPDDSIDYLVPSITVPSGGFAVGSIFDYMGYPPGVEPYIDDKGNGSWSALPFRAYNMIYNEYYKDENLIDDVPMNFDDGPDSASDYTILKRGKRKDYFTSAYPEPQKGDAPLVPIGSSAPVFGNGMTLGLTDGTGNFGMRSGQSGVNWYLADKDSLYGTDVGSVKSSGSSSSGDKGLGVTTDSSKSGLVADLSSAEGVSINDLRFAFQLQRMLERDQRGGTRYVEYLRAQYGCISPDYRLNRPEFLGGATYRFNVNPVVQTSNNDSQTTPQGNLSAFVLVSGSNRWTKSFTEHGQILGLVSIYADKYYCQGIARKFTRLGRYDYAVPVLSHIGMQSILNRELFVSGTSTDNEPFGYTDVYDDYRIGYNRVSGLMRAGVTGSVSNFTIQETFESTPQLSEDFINDNSNFASVVAVPSEPLFYFDGFFGAKVARLLPVRGYPGLIDHG